MNNILIALDQSLAAQKVALMGYELGRAMKAKISLLHVLMEASYYASLSYSPILGYSATDLADLIETDRNSDIQNFAQSFLDNTVKLLGDNKIETIIRKGELDKTIIETAKEQDADIIVIGSNTRRGLDKILLGSVAEKVLHHSPLPVFIIPTHAITP